MSKHYQRAGAWESDPNWDPRADIEYMMSEEFAEKCRRDWELEMIAWEAWWKEIIRRIENGWYD